MDADMSAGAAAGAAAAAAARAQAVRAMGLIVQVEPRDFLAILERQDEPLVVQATSGYFSTTHQYLTSYKGLGFYARSSTPLELPVGVELVVAKSIWVPG
jgi:hypothetical protein